MHSKKVQSIIIIFSAINVVLIVAYVFLYFSIAQKNKSTSEIYTLLHQKESENEKASSVQKSLSSTESKRKILDSYFIKPNDAVLFIEQIEKLGTIVPVDLKLRSVTPPKRTGEDFVVDFSATGSYENMYKLFGVIDKLPYRVSVQKVMLSEIKSSDDKNQSNPMWSGNFTLVLESYLDN